MSTFKTPKLAAASTYNAAADYYDHAANSFWVRFGQRAIDRIGLKPGEKVLDVCCGSGASAIPAAIGVGPNGGVIAVDVAERLLALGKAKAAKEGLKNIDFRVGDMLALGIPDGAFNVVVCVFGDLSPI